MSHWEMWLMLEQFRIIIWIYWSIFLHCKTKICHLSAFTRKLAINGKFLNELQPELLPDICYFPKYFSAHVRDAHEMNNWFPCIASIRNTPVRISTVYWKCKKFGKKNCPRYKLRVSFTVISHVYRTFIPIKIPLLSTVLHGGFQSSRWSFKFAEHDSAWQISRVYRAW